MTDHPTPPPTAHAAVTRGLERALADLGVDLVGCAPSVLSGHVIKELREASLLRTPGRDEPTGVSLTAAERRRQVEQEGYGESSDDRWIGGELARAAVCYATPDPLRQYTGRLAAGAGEDRSDSYMPVPVGWPWHPYWWKSSPDDRIRELVKASALICSEVDRLLRARRGAS